MLGLKKSGKITSFGIRCQYLSDAFNLCYKLDYIDHIELDLDLNSSTELINAVFKMAYKKNISIFSVLKFELFLKTGNLSTTYNNLTNLLNKGKENFYSDLRNNLPKNEFEYFKFSLRHFGSLNFQSILIPLEAIEKIRDFSTFSKLSFDEEIAIQRSFEPKIYESPKKHSQK